MKTQTRSGKFLSLILLTFGLAPRANAYLVLSMPGSLFTLNEAPKPGLANKSEAGLSLTDGNTSTRTFNLSNTTSYRFEESTVQVQANYFESGAQGTLKARKWMLGGRYEMKIMGHWGAFAGESIDGDRFTGYNQRYATDLGSRLGLWHVEKSRGALEIGYRHQLENRVDGQLTSEILRLFIETNYQWTSELSVVLASELLPVLNRGNDWHWNSELDLEMKLSGILRLKNAYGFKYAHAPVTSGLKNLDQMLITSLVADFN